MTDKPTPDKTPRARASKARTHLPHNGPAKGPGHGGPARGGPASGPGWWGPAHGSAGPFGRDNQPSGAAMSAGHAVARTAAEAARHHAVDAVEVWRSVMSDPAAPPQARVIAADKMVERAEGRPVQPVISLDAELGAPIDLDDLDEDEREVMENLLIRLAHKAAVTSGPTIEYECEAEALPDGRQEERSGQLVAASRGPAHEDRASLSRTPPATLDD